MSFKITLLPILFIILTSVFSCDKNGASIAASLDIQSIDSSISSGSQRAYTGSNDDQWFTPDSYIVKIASVVLGDGSGNLTEIIDFENDEDCISLDIAAGEKLSDKINNDFEIKSEEIFWMIIATLPGIEYSYLDTNGVRHSGTLENLPNTIDNGSWAHYYGGARGRAAEGITFTQPDMGWDGKNLTLEGTAPEIDLYLDLTDIVSDINEDGNCQVNEYTSSMFPVTENCSVEYYYIKKSGIDGEVYPFQIRMIKGEDGIPLFHSIRGRNFDLLGETVYQVPELENIGGLNSDCPRDEIVKINEDGSLNLIFPGGLVLNNLVSTETQTKTLGSSTVEIKMVKKF